MHDLFNKLHPSLTAVVSYEDGHRVFNRKFNIAFGYPRSDVCDTREELEVKMKAAKSPNDMQK